MLKGKRFFLTGGAGFIGTTIARLLADDNEVVLYDNLHNNALQHTDLGQHPNITLVQGDILDLELMRGAAANATHIIHMASYPLTVLVTVLTQGRATSYLMHGAKGTRASVTMTRARGGQLAKWTRRC